MAPTTHAAVGAAIAHLCPRVGLAVPAAFASHFLLDSIFHFEAFYPLSQVLGTTHDEAFWIAAVIMAAILVPGMGWIGRRSHDVRMLTLYGVAASAALLVQGSVNRLIALICIAVGAWSLSRTPNLSLWLAGAFAATIPDALKRLVGPVGRFHRFMHYEGANDLGYWLNRLLAQPDPEWFGARATKWTYLTGYAVEIALETALLLGGLWVLTRRQGQNAEGRRSASAPPPR